MSLSQNWSGATITSGSGGAGGRGGDVGSHNYSGTSHDNSHNDNSVSQRVHGDNYSGAVDQGDKYTGAITNSAVGGRGNRNELHNYGGSGKDEPKLSAREMELDERIQKAREKLAAKKEEQERLARKEAELKQLEAELGEV